MTRNSRDPLEIKNALSRNSPPGIEGLMPDAERSCELSQPAHFLSSSFDNFNHAAIGRQCLPTMSSAYVGAIEVSNNYNLGMETIGSRIRAARKAAGLSQQQVAKHFGISRVSVTQWEGDITQPDIAKIEPLATLLNTTSTWLLKRDGSDPKAKNPATATAFKPRITAGKELISQERSLPLYSAARGGDGHIIVSFEAIDYLKMPTILQGVRGGYGLLITGESMTPAYWSGDMALINPNLPPQRDTDVVLYHTDPHGIGEAEAIIKRLVGINDREWTLEQYRPAQVFKEFRGDWPICHRVVGKYNSR